MTWATAKKCGSASTKLVLLMLANHSNGHTAQCNPRHKILASECDMTVETLKTHIKRLEALGLIKIIPQYADGVQLPNQYILIIEGGGGENSPHPGGENSPHPGGGNSPHPGGGNSPPYNQEVKPGIKPIEPDGFIAFWSAYPKKVARPAALRAFKAARLNGNLDEVIADIEFKSQSDDWEKSGGKFIPNPATYLNQRRWEDGEGQVQENSKFKGLI